MPWRRDRLPTPVFLGFPGCSEGKESTCNVGDLGSVPGLGKSHGGGHGNPLQYSCWEDPHAQRSLVGCSPWGRKESDTTERPSTEQHDQHSFPGGASGKEPTGKCRRCRRPGFDPWARKIQWRRAQPPTSEFLPGESHGQRSLVGYKW